MVFSGDRDMTEGHPLSGLDVAGTLRAFGREDLAEEFERDEAYRGQAARDADATPGALDQ